MSDPAPDPASGFTVERVFRVWNYTVSHMTLLLRSPAPSTGGETVDVWFSGVMTISLHQSFKPLTVRAADPEERERLLAHAATNLFDPAQWSPLCLVLESTGSDGFVVCTHATVTANTREPDGNLPGIHLESGRRLWSAGPTGRPEPGHSYTLYEAGRDFLRAQHAAPASRTAPRETA
ncbi:hypothetical protein ACIQF6_03845 [Kitasatospora sp. NPDC092948]|uniref:hypothetical protein n=1 Tax=Kitasatospora sp. NPDC092948 TaxID=3364088 RepID=UPI003830B853